ncbi:L,D-transpeptidase family protein [Rhizobium wenxiniae]|uniref:L,D-transpeptidase family protein n=1 Tax=Rhizobium wenxiniae TaxID=1737357 RepID=UPI001C6F02F5|nr:murein L,D-transpeptidase family protein [Rhizobium wenxiniae]MBW9087106.1 L,D-transpeptidase family protein [Rhizobium wenxiniae]
MRLKHIALALLVATALTGCNDTLDSATGVDISKVKNKVEQPLSAKVVADMQAKNMPRNSPIMIRIYKEEGKLEIWKAKADNRFDMIRSYDICAWSGKLGPKVKEGDRQAPEGFYNLTPAHLNPNSKYYLAINTGFPNRYDAANGRNGTNLMIHGACSSSGCYSMTDEQILEIYAFARDAFRGGQTAVQLQAFPFRMTAENMARHRDSEHNDFWKMIKVGYDNFEVTKRPPEVAVCGKKYVFNQEAKGPLSAAGACPDMSTPPALVAALSTHNKAYDVAFEKAVDKLGNKVWYEPSEAERKAVVAEKRKGRDLAYAPTGTSLAAGKLMSQSEFQAMMEKRTGQPKPASTQVASLSAAPQPATVAERMKQDRLPAATGSIAATSNAPAATIQTAEGRTTAVPVPEQNPLAYTAPAAPVSEAKKPFWKFWDKQ